jgi:DedD protein
MEKDDLLNIKSEKRNIKKPLIYGAIAFLVFIIGVIAYAIYANSTSKDNVVLPPQVNETPKKDTEFKEVPIEVSSDKLNEKLNMEKLVEEDKKSDNKKSNDKNNENKVETKKKKSAEKVEKEEKKVENKSIVNTHPNKKATVKYYIQVAALTKYKKPNKRFLNLIKKEGFYYTFYSTVIVKNNKKIPITKILIGPFKNEKEARTKLKIVKEKITQNAFIFKVK